MKSYRTTNVTMQPMHLLSRLTQPATTHQQTFLYALTSITLLILWQLYFTHTNPITFPIDDPYILLHSAQVLHLGYDPNYSGTPALDGNTSIIHLALVALLLFWLAPLTALLTIQWLAIMAYAFGLLRLAFLFEASLPQAFIFLGSGLSIGYISYQLFNGLETGLALAGILWTLIAATAPSTAKKRLCVALLCGTLPFLRPELIIFSALLLFYQTWQPRWQNLIFTVSFALLAAAPWLIWSWCDTGSLIPQTMAAKAAFFAESHYPLLQKLHYSLPWLSDFILSLGYCSFFGMLAFLVATGIGRLGLLFILLLFTSYVIAFPSAFRDYLSRYLYIILPFLFYGLISAIHQRDKTLRYCANALLILTFFLSLWHFPSRWHTYTELRQYRQQQASEITQWCTQHLPTNAVILVNDAGYMAYATQFHLIDMVGLKTPGSIIYQQQFSAPSGGQRRVQATAAIIAHYQPQYMVISDPGLANQPQLAQLGWRLLLLHHTTDNYWVYAIRRAGKSPLTPLFQRGG